MPSTEQAVLVGLLSQGLLVSCSLGMLQVHLFLGHSSAWRWLASPLLVEEATAVPTGTWSGGRRAGQVMWLLVADVPHKASVDQVEAVGRAAVDVLRSLVLSTSSSAEHQQQC